MATNDILLFGQAGSANVLAQAAYAALTARTAGFQSGVAESDEVNKVLRQSAFMSAALAQWAIDKTGGSILDNGDVPNVESLLTQAVQAIANLLISNGNFATIPQLNAEANSRGQADASEAAARSNADYAEGQARYAGDQAEANARATADQNITNALQLYALLSAFGNDFGTGNGTQRLPGGGIIQWGNYTTPSGGAFGGYVNFQNAFPNACRVVVACEGNVLGWGNPVSPAFVGTGLYNNVAFRLSTVRQPVGGDPYYQEGITAAYIAIGF